MQVICHRVEMERKQYRQKSSVHLLSLCIGIYKISTALQRFTATGFGGITPNLLLLHSGVRGT